MTTIKDILLFFEKIAPLHLQEPYDNAGLLVGDINAEVKGVLTCLDSTEKIIDEAISLDCNVVIAHHPIIFSGVKQLVGANYIQRTIQKAIKNDIAIIAMHTNLDNVFQNGVNERIAKRLALNNLTFLKPKPEPNKNSSMQAGAGIIGMLSSPMKTKDFLAYLKEKMQVNCVKHTRIIKENVAKIAICGGSGGFLLRDAIKQNADVFITADYKYHEFFDADNQLVIADIGHYESEQFTINLLFELIRDNFSNFALHFTRENTNPVNYL